MSPGTIRLLEVTSGSGDPAECQQVRPSRKYLSFSGRGLICYRQKLLPGCGVAAC